MPKDNVSPTSVCRDLVFPHITHWNLFKYLCSDRSKTNYILLGSTIRNLIESFQLYGNYEYIQQGFPCRTKNIYAPFAALRRGSSSWQDTNIRANTKQCGYQTAAPTHFFEMISGGVSLCLKHNFPRWRNSGQFFHDNKTKLCVQSKL